MKYIYAIVKIPMELATNGKCNMLSDRIHTLIEPCDVLPPINEDHTKGIYEQIQQIIEVSPLTNVDHDTDDGIKESEPPSESQTEQKPEAPSEPPSEPLSEPPSEPPSEPQTEQKPEAPSEPVQIKLIMNTPHNSSDHKHNMTFRNSKIKQNKTKKVKPGSV